MARQLRSVLFGSGQVGKGKVCLGLAVQLGYGLLRQGMVM